MKAYLPLVLEVKKLCVGRSIKFIEDDLKVRDVKKHLSRADKAGARFALIAGETEFTNKTIIIKDLLNKTEDKVNTDALEVARRLFEKIDR